MIRRGIGSLVLEGLLFTLDPLVFVLQRDEKMTHDLALLRETFLLVRAKLSRNVLAFQYISKCHLINLLGSFLPLLLVFWVLDESTK